MSKAKVEEGIAGITRLHEMIAEHADADEQRDRVMIGIATDWSPWVQALLAAGYRVYAIHARQVVRYQERNRLRRQE